MTKPFSLYDNPISNLWKTGEKEMTPLANDKIKQFLQEEE